MFKKFPTKMVKINMKISRNRPTHFYLLIFRIFHPTYLFDATQQLDTVE